MKRLYNILLTLGVAAALLACNSPKVIPDKTLGSIFHDALLVNAYLQQNPQYKSDSLNIYEPIFAKYGYTTEDVHHTINNIARRKSASLGNVTNYMTKLMEEQSEALYTLVHKQDTIESVAKRRYGEVLYEDTTIVSKVAADSTRLQIVIPHAKTGVYQISGSYTLDKDDKGIGRRYGVSWMCDDSLIRTAGTFPLVRSRKTNFNATVTLYESDSLVNNLYIDFTRFTLKKNYIPKCLLTIHSIKVEYQPTLDEAVEMLFNEQSQLRIFADTMIKIMWQPSPIEADSTATAEALEGELPIEADSTSAEQPIEADSVKTQTQE